MTKLEKIKALQLEINKLTKELDEELRQNEIEKLTKLSKDLPTFRSSNGTTWYKFPARMKKDAGGDYFFLTDLQGNYIPDKIYYEGRPCKPGWAVAGYYCTTEISAIDCYEKEYAKKNI